MNDKIEQIENKNDDDELINTKNILSFKIKKFKNTKINKSKNLNIINKIENFNYPALLCVIIALLSIFLIFSISNKKNLNEDKKNFSSNNNKKNFPINNIFNIKELAFDNIKISYEKGLDFINKNVDGILIEPNIKNISANPQISAIIPVYNSRDIILRSIRSIQNQNMKDIEIILVNDFSTDDTLPYIEYLQKEDPRIKIIKNQKNMGILYSRSIGALSAKGKYIFSLDNGDMFLDYDVFDTIYNISIKDNFDIVEFKVIKSNALYNLPGNSLLDTKYSEHELNLVLFQPKLGYYPLQPKFERGEFSINDNYLWNKCIKTDIYQKSLNLFGEERYKRHMTLNEDLIIVVLIFNVAESFKFIGKYSVLNVPNSGGGGRSQEIINLYEMYVLDAMIDFSKDIKENKKILVQYMITLLGRSQLEETLKENDNKNLFKSLLNRIYSCDLISNEDKKEIKNRSSKFENL